MPTFPAARPIGTQNTSDLKVGRFKDGFLIIGHEISASGYRILYRNEEGWEQTMMDEIEYNGSITTAFRVYPDFFYHDSKKVYQVSWQLALCIYKYI